MRKLLISIFCVLCIETIYAETEITKFKDNKPSALSLTFDDGLLEHYIIVFQELEKRDLKGSFCINGSKISEASSGKENDRMKWSMLKEMAESGHEITNHGWSHLKVWRLNQEELRYEVQHNDSAIYQNTGQFPRTYIFPGNSKTDTAISFCSKDRVGLRMKQIALGGKREIPELRSRIEKAIEKHESIVGMTHGITRGYDCFESKDKFLEILDNILIYRDKLWICTFHDLSAYETLRDSTKLTEIKHENGLLKRIDIQCDLPKDIFNYPLTLKIPKSSISGKQIKIQQDGKIISISDIGTSILINFNPHGGSILLN